MKLTTNIQKAINYAAIKHKGQVRIGDGSLPYIIHPIAVAWILNSWDASEDVIIAGLLHDTVEDCGVSLKELDKEFGEKIAIMVEDVSEEYSFKKYNKQSESWLVRKQKYLDHIKISSIESMTICVADKIHNLRSFKQYYENFGEKIFDTFYFPSDNKVWFFEEILQIVENNLESSIVEELKEAISQLKQVFN